MPHMLIELTDNEVTAIKSCIEMAHSESYWSLDAAISCAEFNALLKKLGFSENDISYLRLAE